MNLYIYLVIEATYFSEAKARRTHEVGSECESSL